MMGKVFDEWKSGFTYDKADESPFAIFVGHDEYVDAIAADLQRHKDAIGRVGEKVSEFEGHSFDCESNEVMDDLEAMFDSDGYIWPIEGKDDADTQR